MQIQFFYSTSHLTQLLHHVLILFITTLFPFINVIMINSLFSHKVAAHEKQTSTFEELKLLVMGTWSSPQASRDLLSAQGWLSRYTRPPIILGSEPGVCAEEYNLLQASRPQDRTRAIRLAVPNANHQAANTHDYWLFPIHTLLDISFLILNVIHVI